jgi:L-fuculose-phosphate aldolase
MINEHKIKQEICEIGDRLYKKGFASANDGNISYRVAENRVICTPTQISKGFMKPEDLCVVDMDGNQIGGHRPRTSEVFIHLTIMKERPEVKSVMHCHPPYATAFGIAGEPIPQGVIPEVEIFLGNVPIAKYAIPGGQEFADTILPFVHKSNVIVLANHGTISYGPTVERAYWWTEILDAYCKILMIARDLGTVNYFSKKDMVDLLKMKTEWGFEDPRLEIENCDLFGNEVFRDNWKAAQVSPTAFTAPKYPANGSSCNGNSAPLYQPPQQNTPAPRNAPAPLDQEALIRIVTDRVVAALTQQV